jgi:CRP/FNR family transcriptional regulator, anaerobic regulatory protein
MRTNLTHEIVSRKFPLLTDPELLEEIMQNGKFHTCLEEETLFRPGDAITQIPMVLFGRIRLYKENDSGKEVFLYNIRPGETCAVAMGCCDKIGGAQVRAVADEDTELVFIPVSQLENWMIKYKGWREFMMNTLHHRFSDLLNVIDMIAFGQLDERLVYFLKQSARNSQARMIRITHQEIAESLGSSREVITRLLRQLELAGKVKTGRNQLELLPGFFAEHV